MERPAKHRTAPWREHKVTTGEVIGLLALVILNSFLAMARSALVNVRKPRLKQLAEEGMGQARTAERLAEDASRLLATTQLGMMLTRFFAGALVAVISAPALARLLQPWLKGASYPVAFVLVVLLAALIMLLLGELVPETIAVRHSERLALWLSRPLAVVAFVAMPVARLMVWLSNSIARLFGVETPGSLPFVTEEEIKTLVDAGEEEGVIEEDEKAMIYSIFELGDTLVREVMVPRIDMIALEVTTPLLEALDAIMQAGHSRIPVYNETIDNIAGILYVKELLPFIANKPRKFELKKMLHRPYFVPETMPLDDLLVEFKRRRLHLACVVDEYGGFGGIITLEDVIEEIVGDIKDEFDDNEPPEIRKIGRNTYEIDSRMTLTDFNEEAGTRLPTDEFDTIGGLVFDLFGKIPKKNETARFENISFKIKEIKGTRLTRVIVTISRTEQ